VQDVHGVAGVVGDELPGAPDADPVQAGDHLDPPPMTAGWTE
jgi:hypothetical protein